MLWSGPSGVPHWCSYGTFLVVLGAVCPPLVAAGTGPPGPAAGKRGGSVKSAVARQAESRQPPATPPGALGPAAVASQGADDEALEAEIEAWQREHDLVATAIGQYLAAYLQPGDDTPPAWYWPGAYDIPVAYNKHVRLYLDFFRGPGRAYFERYSQRAARYFGLMRDILAQHGLPRDLVYVALIESGMNLSAFSHAGAAGPWQFMRPTAQRFGLRCDREVDERMDLVATTHAAARYLKLLHAEFGDWYLAWAAYNAGEGRLRRAIARAGTRDFWRLVETSDVLALETKQYVGKVIAAALLHRNGQRLGLAIPAVQPSLTLAAAQVPRGVGLDALAVEAGLAGAELREFNRALRRGATPRQGRYKVWLPASQVGRVEQAGRAVRQASERLASGSGRARHTVARGESLGRIAARYQVSVAELRVWNRLQGDHLRVGQQLRVLAPAAAREATARKVTVKAGDTLWGLAKRHKTSIDALLAKNAHLDPERPLRVGTQVVLAGL